MLLSAEQVADKIILIGSRPIPIMEILGLENLPNSVTNCQRILSLIKILPSTDTITRKELYVYCETVCRWYDANKKVRRLFVSSVITQLIDKILYS